jgi:hypothetical protein
VQFDGNLCQICWFVVCNGYVLVLMRGCYHFSVSFFSYHIQRAYQSYLISIMSDVIGSRLFE